jgi:hypothetical protein
MGETNTVNISPTEYERRRAFCDAMKTMTKPEFIEIARILRRNGVTMSENRSGLFFDMSKLSDDVFAELLQFRDFVSQNSTELKKRDGILDSLARSAT